MVVCTFFKQGKCRYGNNCRFEHPGVQQQPPGNPFQENSRGQPRNPFGAPSGGRGGDSYRPEQRGFDNNRGRNDDRGRGPQSFGAQSTGLGSNDARNKRYNEELIRTDLREATLEQWPLSNYSGDLTDVAKHFFDPQMEVSPEELRVEYCLSQLQGQEMHYRAKEAKLVEAAQAEIAKLRQDVPGGIRRVVAGRRENPNRWTIVDEHKNFENPNPFSPAPLPFTLPSGPSQSSAFGQPSPLRANANPFGRPSAQPGGFGQPSQMGQRPSGFGQPSQSNHPSAFGQPSQPRAQANPFGQPLQTQAPSAFGQPSTLGAQGVFGQIPAQAPSSGIGPPSPIGGLSSKVNAFAQNNQQQQSNPFGQASEKSSQTNPFGHQSQNSVTMGQAPQSTISFGQQSTGLSQLAQQSDGGFEQQSSGWLCQQSNGFQKQPATNGFPPPSLNINTAPTMMNGSYKTNAPSPTPKDADPPDEMYGAEKTKFEEAYKKVLITGTFVDGVMPEIAPLNHWIGWGTMEQKFAPR